jgi:Insertion element 4 transposase N-terminal/Transposase DDE domain
LPSVVTHKPASSLGDCFAAAELFRLIPREVVDRALASTNREKRRERLFHDHMVVYFVILMGMFLDLPYLFVMEKFANTLSWLQLGAEKLATLSEPAIVQARQRIGASPLRALFKLFACSLSTEETPGAFFHGLRLVVIDGTTFIVSDSKENAKQFGRPANQSGPAGMPQIRCVALIEYATRVFIDLVFGPYEGSSEQSLAPALLSKLQPGMLCMGDRLYPSYEFCKMVVDTGAHFCFRVKKDFKLSPTRVLNDGSYEARLYLHINRKKQRNVYVTVRVVKYNVAGHSEEIRLITSLLDHNMVPAIELAKLYPVRWTEETTYDELKSVLRCRDLVLRSRSPEMVEQELYGVFLAHYLVRCFMFSAASQGGIPPDALSFNRAIYLVRENLPKLGDFSPGRNSEKDH